MRLTCLMAATVLAAIALATPLPALAEDKPAADAKSAAPAVAEGSAACLGCHEDNMKGMLQTRHAVSSDGRTPWGSGKPCQACHGESVEHMSDPTKVKPSLTFGKTVPAAQRSAPCLVCHQDGDRLRWASSAHSRNDIACNDCHNPHKAVQQALIASTQAGVCFDCHKDKRAASLKLSTHPIRTGWMPCSSCHSPHGSVNEAQLVKSTVNETCYVCHADKRGPHLWEHPPVADDCGNCHDPHGTNNPPLLNTRQPFLCQQCHMNSRHPSSVYSGANLPPSTSADKMLGMSCLNCHSKIHGSNHPSGAVLMR